MRIFSREAVHRFWLPGLLATTISLVVVVFSRWMFYGYSPLLLYGIGAILLCFFQWLIVRYGRARWWKIIAGSAFTSLVFMSAAVIAVVGPDDHEIAMHLVGVLIYGVPFGLLHGTLFAIVAWIWSSVRHAALERNIPQGNRSITLGVLGAIAAAILLGVVFIIVFRSIFWGQGSMPLEVSFSPNGRFLAIHAGRIGDVNHEVQVWDVENQENVLTLGEEVFVDLCGFDCGQMGFLPDGNRIIMASATAYHILEVDSGKHVLTIESGCDGIGLPLDWTVSSDGGRLLVNCGGASYIFDSYSGQRLWSYQGQSRPFEAVLSPSGDQTFVGEGSDPARIFDVESGTVLETLEMNNIVSAAFSPDGLKIVTIEGNFPEPNIIHIWDLKTNRELLQIPTDNPFHLSGSLSISPDGRWFYTNAYVIDHTVLLDIEAEEPHRTIESSGTVLDDVFSSTGKLFLYCVIPDDWEEERSCSVWDVKKGERLYRIADAAAIDISSGEDLVAVGMQNGSVNLLDAYTGEEVFEIELR